jgi:hypothetical protein
MAKAVAAVTMNTAIAAMSRRRCLPRPAGRRVTPTRTWVTRHWFPEFRPGRNPKARKNGAFRHRAGPQAPLVSSPPGRLYAVRGPRPAILARGQSRAPLGHASVMSGDQAWGRRRVTGGEEVAGFALPPISPGL